VRRSASGKSTLNTGKEVAKTTDYSRVQALLELAVARKAASAEDLVQSIVRRSPPNFVFHRWDREKGEVVGHCSETSVRKTLALASDLGLVDGESGALTTEGTEASDPDRFSSVVRKRIQAYLSRSGCPVQTIAETCVAMLKRKNLVLPTSDELYMEVCVRQDVSLDPQKFRTLLRLLAQCDGIRISRRHIFLPSN
jgi:hypothetical protein